MVIFGRCGFAMLVFSGFGLGLLVFGRCFVGFVGRCSFGIHQHGKRFLCFGQFIQSFVHPGLGCEHHALGSGAFSFGLLLFDFFSTSLGNLGAFGFGQLSLLLLFFEFGSPRFSGFGLFFFEFGSTGFSSLGTFGFGQFSFAHFRFGIVRTGMLVFGCMPRVAVRRRSGLDGFDHLHQDRGRPCFAWCSALQV